MATSEPIWVARFWKYVDKTDTCWLWTASRRNGYGAFWDGTRHNYAHRVLFAYVNGPIPAGMELDHLCRVRRCVNPEHLEVVTPEENQRRIYVPSTACAYGHAWTKQSTYIDPLGYRHCRICRAENEKGKHAATPLVACEWCDKPFKPYTKNGRTTRCCSVSCSNKTRSKIRVGA